MKSKRKKLRLPRITRLIRVDDEAHRLLRAFCKKNKKVMSKIASHLLKAQLREFGEEE